ncbi:tetratricopeptide repeat protein [Umezawaea beigongshangensis]|uniref:tetratricopeptide repeat protein n=1 Tax=Umezawaea beigongshangensis TaxID=2780383 RepID=UPI001E423A8C|nr:tetratricopeptide repeat protein [Umezawaea beigongshangensis]
MSAPGEQFLPGPHRKLVLVVLAVSAAAALAVGATSAPAPEPPAVATVPAAHDERGALFRSADVLRDRLRRLPGDADGWARLGTTYVEIARVTADASYYPRADGALRESLRVRPDGNGAAMLGRGALASALHDFSGARDWALRAVEVLPGSVEAHGVLADALTQLGDDDGAASAVQRMLDLRPGVAAFTRASYHLELHGDDDGARDVMGRALAAASTPEEIAFCRYHLGELAFGAGELDEAAEQVRFGLAASPHDPALLRGAARVAAARGETGRALAGYREVVERAPLPQHLLEFAELLEAAGRGEEAREQFTVLAEQQRAQAAQGAGDDLTASRIAADHGDPAEALRLAEAEWGRRRSVFTADALAWALHVGGRDAEALPLADLAVATGWRDAAVGYHRGTILAALGRTDEAVRVLSDALARNPHFSPVQAPEARAALARLRSGR